MKLSKMLSPAHPGEVLLKDYLKPMGLSQYRLAKSIRVPPRRVNEIVLGSRGITADTALRLARFFGTTVEVWMNLQSRFEIEQAQDRLADELAHIEPVRAVA
jgi:antitoxin HigA-1